MHTLKVIWAIFVKDIKVEWRSRETLASMSLFGLLIVFLFNFAFEPAREESLRLLPGLLWISFAFAGILGFNRAFAGERENQCLEGLSLAPVDPGAIYLGKVLANLFFLIVAEAVVVFATSLWYNFSFLPSLRWFSCVLFLGTLGYVAVGTNFAAVAANTDRKSTRLNSSHVRISYAVFCLKKKNDVTMDAVALAIAAACTV